MTHRTFQSFFRNRRATSAIEFALIAPVYFALVFGTLEIALISWFSTLVAEGAERGASYMRDERLAGRAFTDEGIRAAACASVSIAGLSCTEDKLKVATFYAGVPSNGSFGLPTVIENVANPRRDGGQQMLALAYNWGGMGLPTARILLPTGPDGALIQGRTYVVLAERVWDDGVRR